MLMPKKVKYRKQQRGRMAGKAWRGSDVVVRRLRPEGARALLADGPADRGGARRDDPVHQARRQDLDPRVPGQADHQEAAGNAHGQGQGRARGVGVRRAAGPDPVRDGRRDRDRRARGDAPGRGQAADQDAGSRRGSPRRRRHEGRRSSAISGSTSCSSARRISTISCSACGSRSRWGSSRRRDKLKALRRDLARVKTVLREKETV